MSTCQMRGLNQLVNYFASAHGITIKLIFQNNLLISVPEGNGNGKCYLCFGRFIKYIFIKSRQQDISN